MDPSFFEKIAKNLVEALPESLKVLSEDLEKNFKSILETSFSKLNLVTREEFDVQTKVLEKTRAQLEELSNEVAILEAKMVQQDQ